MIFHVVFGWVFICGGVGGGGDYGLSNNLVDKKEIKSKTRARFDPATHTLLDHTSTD